MHLLKIITYSIHTIFQTIYTTHSHRIKNIYHLCRLLDYNCFRHFNEKKRNLLGLFSNCIHEISGLFIHAHKSQLSPKPLYIKYMHLLDFRKLSSTSEDEQKNLYLDLYRRRHYHYPKKAVLGCVWI